MANELPSSSGDNLQDKELSKEGIIDILGEDDDKSDKDREHDDEEEHKEGEDKEDEDKDDDAGKEEIELKDDEEKPAEEEEDKLITPFKKRELLKKYPTILKEFPYLERAYYRDAQFTEVYPTPAEAKEAAERLQGLDSFEQDWANGDINNVVAAIKEYDPKAYAKLIDNYIPSLANVDPEAHLHVVGGVVKNIIISLAREGKQTDNDELRKAALVINRYFFSSDQFTPQPKLSESKPEEEEIQNERAEWVRERFDSSRDDLDTRVENVLKSTITHHIDPKEDMTDYVKKTAIKDSLEAVKDHLDRDVPFRKHLDTLWRKAFESNFNKPSLDAIKSAYLSKAKTVLPQVIRKMRNEALKGSGKRVRSEDVVDTRTKGHMPPSRSSSSSETRGHKKEIPKGMTTLEYLSEP